LKLSDIAATGLNVRRRCPKPENPTYLIETESKETGTACCAPTRERQGRGPHDSNRHTPRLETRANHRKQTTGSSPNRHTFDDPVKVRFRDSDGVYRTPEIGDRRPERPTEAEGSAVWGAAGTACRAPTRENSRHAFLIHGTGIRNCRKLLKTNHKTFSNLRYRTSSGIMSINTQNSWRTN